MSTRREDDSRPKGNVTSQRTTARDVPIAKYKEVPVGTSPPGALRGPALLPGQGAPERIIPEEVELAVLRSAETLDGPNVARAARHRPELPGSPSPTPVSVEVPRVRSVPPGLDELSSTPPSPSGRSIQSGTLMSVGSVDPRAPTELSLPSPRPLSVSERAAYFGPGAVVNRSSPVSAPPERHSQPAIDGNQLPAVAARPSSPGFEPSPNSSPRSIPLGSGSPSPRASQPDSVAPPAQNFARAPRSYSPVAPASSPAPRSPAQPPEAEASRLARPGARSSPNIAPQFQVHAELDALPRELLQDNFDLRSAYTQREPLASRKPQPSSDWIAVHAPVSDRAAIEPMSRPSSRHSTSAMTLLVDRGRESSPPGPEPAQPKRPALPLGWLLAATIALLVALLAVWVLRAPTVQDTARAPDDRASASAPSAPLLLPPSSREPAKILQTALPLASAPPPPALPHPASPAVKSPSAQAAQRSTDPFASPPPAPPAAADASARAHQSIY